ncbi:Crp/Fnr family transcriptional regulator [Desulfobaculum bizertense]|uniref:Crp-like helix-turn-helix domain-containing protein n=1 Tax=Desulfobaculum bizertense DSM 18034 TaxID=1121442 RepID=A0A1T4VQT2_9BACT|nr:Crp/Fnr family transcriptional regulator [Desulfobaculum bizertense]UIJ38310.1 Crp/Fnr family transcriptional regulator [Desulfobaculum bizertense]SKA67352.1 Crp-like helix-turn-helix domain-containing protein [Desulfobaculum bizertense DSM 18034]
MTSMANQREFLWISRNCESWKQVLHLGAVRTYEKNEIIIHCGGVVDHLYYLAEGEIRLSFVSPDGVEKVIWYVQPGTIFGETPFFDGKPADSLSTAVEKSVVYAFPRHSVYGEIAQNYPEVWQDLLKTLALKVRTLCNQIYTLSIADLKQQVCKFLLQANAKNEGPTQASGEVLVECGLSQEELGCVLGVHRVSISKVLKQLKEEGVISKCTKKTVLVTDWERLLEYAVL